MCFEEEGDLISPCAGCRGSSAFVHESCVVRAYKARRLWYDVECPTCRHAYEPRILLLLGRVGLARLKASIPSAERAADMAQLLSRMGSAHADLGQHGKGIEKQELSLVAAQLAFGRAHPHLAGALSNLANAYGRLGNARRQRDLLLRALRMHERFRPDRLADDAFQKEGAMLRANLATAYGGLNQKGRMCELLEESLVTLEQLLGPERPEVATALYNLGRCEAERGNWPQSRSHLRRALTLQERQFGADHRDVVMTLWVLGRAELHCGNAGDARRLLERVWAVRVAELGDQHQDLVRACLPLAKACAQLGDTTMQKAYLSRAVEILQLRSRRNRLEILRAKQLCSPEADAAALDTVSTLVDSLSKAASPLCRQAARRVPVLRRPASSRKTKRVLVLRRPATSSQRSIKRRPAAGQGARAQAVRQRMT